MDIKRDQIESSLLKKGFVSDDDRDHRFFHHVWAGKRTGIKTKISRGSKYRAIDASLQSKMKKQLKLDTSEEFRGLVLCPMAAEDYLEKLRTRGLIP